MSGSSFELWKLFRKNGVNSKDLKLITHQKVIFRLVSARLHSHLHFFIDFSIFFITVSSLFVGFLPFEPHLLGLLGKVDYLFFWGGACTIVGTCCLHWRGGSSDTQHIGCVDGAHWVHFVSGHRKLWERIKAL